MKVSFFLILFSLILMASCQQDIQIKTANVSGPALIWNYNSPILRSGESVPFAFTNGVPAYTTNANGVGTFDSTTLVYSTPVNQAPLNHTITARDSEGKRGTNALKISGFQPGIKIPYPETFGDQNFPTSSVTLANGNIFVSSIVGDSPGWERWVINRSTDVGATWTKVDEYIFAPEGETHAMSMVGKNNDLYVCGYAWELASPVYDSEWIVRKSTDNGVTWTISDQFAITPNQNHVCYDIALHSASGNLYAVGYESSNAVVRESTDNGTTWTTIYSTAAVSLFSSVKVSPNGVVWVVDNNGDLYQGTETLGVWLWSNITNITGAISNTAYALRGDLEIVTNNEAYFSGAVGARWKIARTTDGGATWNDVYVGPANSYGQDIKRLSSGEFVSTGKFTAAPSSFVVLHSPDGITWTNVYQENAIAQQGVTLTEANDGSIMGFGYYDSQSLQIVNVRSTDGGTTWLPRGTIFFKQQLYTYLTDFVRDSLGNLWTTAETMYITFGEQNPWVVMKSSDNGTTWTQNDVFSDPVIYYNTQKIAVGPSNEIYVSGTDNADTLIRKTSDSGATWNEVERIPGITTWQHQMSVASNGTVYMTGTNFANCDIHKGTANGTAWSVTETFPILPGYTQCAPLSLFVQSDGSVWFTTAERSGGAIDQTAIYRSTDGGVTFTEVFRENFTNYTQTLIEDSNGDIFAHSQYTVMKTSDNGTTWQTVYDGLPTLKVVRDFAFDTGGKLYVLDTSSKVWAVNQFDSSWFNTYDYMLGNTLLYPAINRLVDCGNASRLCGIAYYDEAGYGSGNQLIPLVIP